MLWKGEILVEDFSQIVLDKNEWKDLYLAYRGALYFRPFHHGDGLINYGLLLGKHGKENPNILSVSITDTGKRYVLYARRKRREKLVPIWISIAALVISGIALLGQLGIIPVQQWANRPQAISEAHTTSGHQIDPETTRGFFSF